MFLLKLFKLKCSCKFFKLKHSKQISPHAKTPDNLYVNIGIVRENKTNINVKVIRCTCDLPALQKSERYLNDSKTYNECKAELRIQPRYMLRY